MDLVDSRSYLFIQTCTTRQSVSHTCILSHGTLSLTSLVIMKF